LFKMTLKECSFDDEEAFLCKPYNVHVVQY
jgi:hypothetical protein